MSTGVVVAFQDFPQTPDARFVERAVFPVKQQ